MNAQNWIAELHPGHSSIGHISSAPGRRDIATTWNDEQAQNAAFIVRACNSHDALVRALRELLEQIDCLNGIELSKDLEPYKAEACWDDALRNAASALKAAGEHA